MSDLVPVERIEKRIFLLRGYKVMLDSDLAVLYKVQTRALNQAVKRNIERFPEDFMFQLTWEELSLLRSRSVILNGPPPDGSRSQSVTLKRGKNVKYLPHVFTEHGALMLASVLNSPIAVQTSLLVVRAFIRLREMIASHKGLVRRLDSLEEKYDVQFKVVFNAIRALMDGPETPRERIGFRRR